MRAEKLQKPVAYVPVRMPQSMVDALKRHHGDNLSMGVRQAIKHYLTIRDKGDNENGKQT